MHGDPASSSHTAPPAAQQFVPSKALPGGGQGVAALEASVDLGKALQLTNMDLESLRDPARLPELSEALAAKQAVRLRTRAGSARRQLSRSMSCGNASFLPACCDIRPAVVGGGEQSQAPGMEADGMEAPRGGWWCCGAAPQQSATAAHSDGSINGSAVAVQQQQQQQQQEQQGQQQQQDQQQDGEGKGVVQLAGHTTPPPATPGAAAAGAAAADGSLSRQRSFVHVKRFSTLLLRGSRAAGGASRENEAGAADAAGSEQTGQPEAVPELLPLHSALTYPDSIVLDDSGSWVCLPAAGSSRSAVGEGGLSRQATFTRRELLRYDRG